jgi:hypothetical protein
MVIQVCEHGPSLALGAYCKAVKKIQLLNHQGTEYTRKTRLWFLFLAFSVPWWFRSPLTFSD